MTWELPEASWPGGTDASGPGDPYPSVSRTNPHARICANCLSLAHMWSVPQAENIALPVIGERYGLTMWRCVCHCGCPAVMATAGPALGSEAKRPEGR